jgi:hypothetical protein
MSSNSESVSQEGEIVEAVAIESPQFLHPTSVAFDFLAQIRTQIVPAIATIFGAAQGSLFFVGWADFLYSFRFCSMQFGTLLCATESLMAT